MPGMDHTHMLQRIRCTSVIVLMLLGVASLSAQSPVDQDSLETALLTLILPRHPEIVARRAALDFADGRLRAAGRQTAPTLSAEVEEIPDGIDVPNAGQMRLMFERDFLTGPVRSAERTIARVERDGAAAALSLTEASVRAAVKRDLAVWRGWLSVAGRLAAEDSLLQEAESGLLSRFSTGDARYVDVLRIRTERLRVKSERAEALRTSQTGKRHLEANAGEVDSSVAELGRLLSTAGIHPGTLLPAPPPVPGIDSLLAAGDALRLASLRVDNARGLAARSRAARRTQLSGGVGIQRFTGDKGDFTVGPSLRATISLPFAVSTSNRLQQAAADLRIADAEAERAAFVVRLRIALLLAMDHYASAVERLQVYDGALLTGAKEERESALSAYRSGQLSLLELLDFERALSRAETDHLRAAIDVSTAYADIYITLATQAGPKAEPSDSGASDD